MACPADVFELSFYPATSRTAIRLPYALDTLLLANASTHRVVVTAAHGSTTYTAERIVVNNSRVSSPART